MRCAEVPWTRIVVQETPRDQRSRHAGSPGMLRTMVEDAPAPEFFVARDRARRFARYLREALQERKLHYRGADVGMASLLDEADAALAAVLEDARGTIADVLHERIRDRECGYMEVPLVVATEGLIDRVDLARRMDRARTSGGVPERDARAAVLALLDDALQRLDAFCGAYDEKRPLGAARTTNLAHLLEKIEQHDGWERALAQPRAATAPAYDRAPPDVSSDPAGLEDLLRALRAAVPGAAGPWRVEAARPDRPLVLSLGTADDDAQEVPIPERLARARDVLALVQAVDLTCLGRPGTGDVGLLTSSAEAGARIDAVRLALPDEAAAQVEESLARAAGPEGALDPRHEKAVRALLDAPPLPPAGPPPPARLVALLGVLRTLDEVLIERVLPRAQSGAVRVAASRLPREASRKAPIVRSVTAQLEARFRGFPAHRAGDVTAAAADGKLVARHMTAADAGVLLALFGRRWNAGGRQVERALDLPPLTDEEVETVAQALCTIAAIRRDLDAGRDVDPARIGKLETSVVGVLGRLGRVPAP